MITFVKLKNWRSHEETTMNFDSGTNILVGRMGSGKSSVMDAICFALFGNFPALQQKKLKLDDILQSRPKPTNEAEVTVSFTLEGDEYKVRRVVERGKGTTTSELRKNDELIEAPQSSKVTEYIERILKMDYDLFTRAVYSEQNQLDYFLTIPKGNRMKKIDELLQIDKFEKARANTTNLINKIKSKTENVRENIERIRSNPNIDKIVTLNREIAKIRIDVEKDTEMLENVRDRKDNLKAKLSELQSAKQQIEKLEKNEAQLYAVVERLEQEVQKEVPERRSLEQNIEIAQSMITQLSAQISELENRIADEQNNLNSCDSNCRFVSEKINELEIRRRHKEIISQKISDLDAQLQQLENLEHIRNQLKDYEQEYHKNNARISELQNSVQELVASEGRCPVCDSELTEEHRAELLEEKNKQLLNISERADIIKKDIQERRAAMEEAESLVNEAERLKQQIADMKPEEELEAQLTKKEELERMLAGYKSELSSQRQDLTEAKATFDSEQAKLSELKSNLRIVEEHEKAVQEHAEYTTKMTEVKQQLDELAKTYSEQELSDTTEDYQEMLQKESGLKVSIESAKQVLDDKDAFLRELAEQRRMLDNYKKDEVIFNNMVSRLEDFKRALEDTQVALRENFIGAVNDTMNLIWPDLYPYEDFTAVRLKVAEGDYVLQLCTSIGAAGKQEWVNVEGFASGGERSIACLALRIAFSLVLAAQLRWLVLDEPTHNLDQKTIETFTNILREKVTQLVNQIFVITHEEQLESAVTGSLYRLTKESKEGISRTEKV